MDFEVRADRRPQGRKKLSRERETYLLLVDQGTSHLDACGIVGINDRTGRRWRNGRQASGKNKAAPPLVETGPWRYTEAPEPAAAQEPEDDAPSRYLREADRIHIADRLREKVSGRTIAAELGRSPSTISREIRRNRTVLPSSQWYYRPHAAHRRAIRRRPRPKVGKIGQNPELRDFVQQHLTLRWSPEQIRHALRRRFPATLVERSTRYLMLVHLPNGHGAAAVRKALVDTVQTLPAHLKRSLTWDQGAEMAAHHAFSVATDVPVYFCDPGSPWQPLTARLEREHQRPPAAVLPQGQQPVRPHPGPPRRSRCRTQQPPTQGARLGNPSRAPV